MLTTRLPAWFCWQAGRRNNAPGRIAQPNDLDRPRSDFGARDTPGCFFAVARSSSCYQRTPPNLPSALGRVAGRTGLAAMTGNEQANRQYRGCSGQATGNSGYQLAQQHHDQSPKPSLRHCNSATPAAGPAQSEGDPPSRAKAWQQLLPLVPVPFVGTFAQPYHLRRQGEGYLSVISPASELNMFDSLTVEHGRPPALWRWLKRKPSTKPKKSLRGDFLEGLLAGTLPRKEIERLEGQLDPTPKNPTPSWWLAGWETTAPACAGWNLSPLGAINHPRPALVHIFGTQYLVIFQALKNPDDMDSAHQLRPSSMNK